MEECKHGLTEDSCSVCRHGPTPRAKARDATAEPRVWRDHGVLLPEVPFDETAAAKKQAFIPWTDPTFTSKYTSPCHACGLKIERFTPAKWAAEPRKGFERPPLVHVSCAQFRPELKIEWKMQPTVADRPDDFWSRVPTAAVARRVERKRAYLRAKTLKSWSRR